MDGEEELDGADAIEGENVAITTQCNSKQTCNCHPSKATSESKKSSNPRAIKEEKTEIDEASTSLEPKWRKKIKGGYRIRFVLDSGQSKQYCRAMPSQECE